MYDEHSRSVGLAGGATGGELRRRLLLSPVSLADARALLVSRRGSGGSPAWAAPRLWPCLYASRAAGSFGPAQLWLSFVSLFVLFYYFTELY